MKGAMNNEEHFIIHVQENDYDRPIIQYIEEGFTTFESALKRAKMCARNVNGGRYVCYEATIYQVSRCVTVYQHITTNDYIVTEETVF